MRRLRHIVLVLALAAAVLQPAGFAGAAIPDRDGPRTSLLPPVSATQLTVRVGSASDMARLEAELKRTGGTILSRSADGEAVLVEAPATRSSSEYAEALTARTPVAYAAPVGIVTAAAIPSDPNYSTQWGLPRVGAPAAWDHTWGSASVVIAIIDSGVTLDHPELVDRIQPGGKDFVPNPDDFDPSDEYGHGTGVAGIAVAQRNNALYGVGMAPDCKILPLRILDANGNGTTFDLAEAIKYAADQGVDVINLSLGGATDDPNVELAVQYALERDVVVVAASGNENASSMRYPAAYPGVVAVGATDSLDARWVQAPLGSNYGSGLDLMAPGVRIGSIALEPGFFEWTGTSMSVPFVTGTIALMRSVNPDASAARIVSVLTSTARDLDVAGWDIYTGWGLIRADVAIAHIAVPHTSIGVTPPAAASGWHDSPPTITLTPDAPGITYYRWDDEPVNTYTEPLTVTSEGSRTLTYWSEDTEGDVEAPKTQVFRLDTVNPSTPSAVTATALGTDSVRIQWTASTDVTSGLKEYQVRRTPTGPAVAVSSGTSAVVSGLVPGTLHTFYVVASDVAGNLSDASAPVSATTASAIVLVPVFRFYDVTRGTHFYTSSQPERDMVIAKWPHIFTYEGVAYSVLPSNNSQPLYRFYNKTSASHFYTASTTERNMIIRTWPHIFTYEGETYRVTPVPESGKTAVYRFYNARSGSHFYTASVEEREAVIARLNGTYLYEGPAFWLGQ